MNVLSPFQILPYHVIRTIVNHVAGSSRVQSDGVVVYSDEYREILMPLLWVCHDFRAVALPLCCSSFKPNIDGSLGYGGQVIRKYLEEDSENELSDEILHRLNTGDPSNAYFGYPTHHMANKLEIIIGELLIYSGILKRVLSGTLYDGCAFPRAYKLLLRVVFDDGEQFESDISQETKANIHGFAQWIKTLAPKVDDILISFEGFSDVPEIADPNSSYLVSQLFGPLKRVEYSCCSDGCMIVEPQLDVIRNLEFIECVCASNCQQFMLLAQHSASTLLSLAIIYTEDTDVSSLILNSEGDYVTYPLLHTLKLLDVHSDDPPGHLTFKGAIPFPALRSLHITGGYLFGDNTPFCGNADTLEFLDMKLDYESVDVLIDCNIFTPTSHSKLKCVKTSVWPGLAHDQFSTTLEALQFLFGIG
ncbi:hypothetical protein GGI19_004344 [Coemansia pectinata]|uniref:Uncharacterized protein n=1 Tax=Coemansia pectinata TaxID=1052879 RepID=A0A9W8GWF7_9FUNG|nr:hypothetical protein GGI19_004344 [Coemansia pectinata]